LQITWCFGHMTELQEPAFYNEEWKAWRLESLPMIPDQFALRVRKGVQEQWAVVSKLLCAKGVSSVVNACDAGREGELIFRYVYDLTGCTHPCERLWIASLTDEAIRRGWKQLRPGSEFDSLADAARCRGESDWLVGLNATRAMTCLVRKVGGQQLLSVGRVQTPTLAMIVKRDHEIENFEPEIFWQVKAKLEAAGSSWQGVWYAGQDKPEAKSHADEGEAAVPNAERLSKRELAAGIAAAAEGQPGVVQSAYRKQKKEKPPLLYDLTSLQRRANQRYGLSAQQTLDLAQALYERHKVLTYPRTDARFITDDQVGSLAKVLEGLQKVGPYSSFAAALLDGPIKPGKRVVNAAEVGDHHAILPTGVTPRSDRMSPDEKRIFDLVARRFMAVLSPDAVVASATIVVAIDPNPNIELDDSISRPLTFRAKGRVVRVQGWRAVDPPGRSKERELPNVEKGDPARANKTAVSEGQTRPPRPHNDASILYSMETAGRDLEEEDFKRAMRSSGLGTPATRASILQTLIARQYAERKGKDLRSTARGRALIQAVPVDELKSARLTGQWEARLAQIADGRHSREEFMSDVVRHVREVIAAIASAEPPPAEARVDSDAPVLGVCPLCGHPVREGRGAYGCDSGRSCNFVIFKKIAKRPISKRTVKQLLKGEQTKVMKGFKSKQGKEFSAALALSEDGRARFVFEDSRPPALPRVVGHACPLCREGVLIRGKQAWGCERWRVGCNFRLPFAIDGSRLADREAIALLSGQAVRGVRLDPAGSFSEDLA
jgi:DNA topoisomerase-3